MIKSGFTLIEIVIALLVVAVGLVGILALFPVGFDASGRASSITEATFLAQELVEDLKREGYVGPTVATALTSVQPGICEDYLGNSLNYEYDIWAYETGVTDLREVVVRVYWPSDGIAGGSRTGLRNVELSTYLAKYEP
ncbi:MAG: prepilin-type N-terminal cleavage/methylation domain-containing protein [Candidatus Omnitrophica bacterium]|nr:prepilin-type N-terminal cleavage/methylation domain-containing protein [Candidatus Omnitrophota bacterium]